MTKSIFHKDLSPNLNIDTLKVIAIISVVCAILAGLTILQDLMESYRSGYEFHLNESLLFKIYWLLFIPILTILYQKLRRENIDSSHKITPFIILPIFAHLLFLPFVALIFSQLFFEGRYGLYKFFSYSLSHNFYTLIIVYSGFVLLYKYFSKSSKNIAEVQDNQSLKQIVINNGKSNTIICVNDILQITSATPYIFIHLENKKHLLSETLKSICQQLDSNNFLRVHKSTIVNLSKVDSFKSRLNGDYDIQLVNGETLRLSRTYASDFKKRFRSGHRDNI